MGNVVDGKFGDECVVLCHTIGQRGAAWLWSGRLPRNFLSSRRSVTKKMDTKFPCNFSNIKLSNAGSACIAVSMDKQR